MPILDYTGKRVVVTGGADGIGYEMSSLFAEQGGEVFILDLNAAAAAEKAAALRAKGYKAHGIECNVTKEASVKAAFEEIAQTGRVDVLCNNAGIGHVGNIFGTEVADVERVMVSVTSFIMYVCLYNVVIVMCAVIASFAVCRLSM